MVAFEHQQNINKTKYREKRVRDGEGGYRVERESCKRGRKQVGRA